jgi:hypothetical protein
MKRRAAGPGQTARFKLRRLWPWVLSEPGEDDREQRELSAEEKKRLSELARLFGLEGSVESEVSKLTYMSETHSLLI